MTTMIPTTHNIGGWIATGAWRTRLDGVAQMGGGGNLRENAVNALFVRFYTISDDRSQTVCGLSFCIFRTDGLYFLGDLEPTTNRLCPAQRQSVAAVIRVGTSRRRKRMIIDLPMPI